MPSYPAGTVTFLFSDIEQSTRGWERDAAAARIVVERHIALIRQAVADNTHGRSLGFLGEPTVNVLELNVELDQKYPAKS